MASVSVLHFTDLHIGMKELPADWPTLEARLFEDLGRVREMSGPWDLLLFTGDLAFSGGASDFGRLQAFLERLWGRFRELDCAPMLVAVPGNHDLAWPPEHEARAMREGWKRADFRQDFWTADKAGNRRRLCEAFAAYEAWWGELCRREANKDAGRIPVLLPETRGLLPGDFTATFEGDGVALGLLGLNTTFLQLRKGMRAGSLAVGRYQFQATSDGGDLPTWVKRHDACLLLTHHPMDWLGARARGELRDHVIDVVRPALHLYGHMHRSEQERTSRNGGPIERRLQGAALFGIERWDTAGEERIHGYSSLRLDFKESETILRLWPRRLVRVPDVGLRLRADQDYDLVAGSEEIEPIVIGRPPGARDVSPWQSRAAVELGELGLRVWGPRDDSDELAGEFEKLTDELDGWLAEAPRKRGAPRLRVLWLVGEDTPHRADALRACLGHASARKRTVVDAGRNAVLAGRAAESCLRSAPRSPPLIGVELDADQPDRAWTDMRDTLMAAKNAHAAAMQSEYARLVVAGDAEQAELFARRLEWLAEVVTVDSKGRPMPRPIGFSGIVKHSDRVFNRGLPMTAKELFGRGPDLRTLRDAWASDTIRVLPVVAFGGTGKSALVNQWLREMDAKAYDQAKVLAWSFYSQGTRENLVSADEFINFASEWLGQDEEETRTLSAWSRGVKLAELIKAQGRFLLVLDGMEPLQHARDSPENLDGHLTDDALKALLEGLSKGDWEGLCVVTTRLELTDLVPFEEPRDGEPARVVRLKLGNLEPRPAAELLERLIGRRADPQELREAAADVEGHALALTLLGNYIRDVHGGDLKGRVDLEKLTDDKREGDHARRVMEAYAAWLGEGGRSAELAILHLIGLFDRPAEPSAMNALLGDDDLGELSGGLRHFGGDVWNEAVAALQRMGLLNEDTPEYPGTLDSHPLVREHFSEELRRHPAEWLAGNRVLFDYYCDLPPEQPSEAKWMGVLYTAVTHGCAAGEYQKVYDVLLNRVWRGRRINYSTRRLGLTGGDLVALSNYFERRRWTRLRDVKLAPSSQTLIRTNAGVRLRQLGRLIDARDCFSATLKAVDSATAEADELMDASYAAAQSCELLVIDGKLTGGGEELDNGLVAGGLAVDYADRIDDPYFAMHARSSLAEVHFMLGANDRARELFDEAREIERSRKPKPPFLYSQGLFRFGYYLIETGQAAQVLEEAATTEDWGGNGDDSSLLSRAIRLLVLGAARRVLIEEGEGRAQLLPAAEEILEEATMEFRAAGYPDYIVRGLLERAAFYTTRRTTADYSAALADLDTAAFHMRDGQMKLLSVDVLLGRARCQLAFWCDMTDHQRDGVRAAVRDDLDKATRMIDSIGYGRRRRVLEKLKATADEVGVYA